MFLFLSRNHRRACASPLELAQELEWWKLTVLRSNRHIRLVLASQRLRFAFCNVARCSIHSAVAKRQRPNSYLWQQQGSTPDV